ncbi:MAG: hypothetical protein EB015_22355 [Methylocystaceae bacterium]|nr:hypothetical protein [Methylocystaceae bacterium]
MCLLLSLFYVSCSLTPSLVGDKNGNDQQAHFSKWIRGTFTVKKAIITFLFSLSMAPSFTSLAAESAKTDCSPYVVLQNQSYALCAGALSWIYDDITYAKCQVFENGNSISLPLNYPSTPFTPGGNIATVNAIGAGPANGGYLVSTYSPPEQSTIPNGNMALYNCKAQGSYAQCDGGICFTSTTGQYFPGLGQVGTNEVMCSCPITTARNYQVYGPNPCPTTRREFDSVCGTGLKPGNNGAILRIGAPKGGPEIFAQCLTGAPVTFNTCERPRH